MTGVHAVGRGLKCFRLMDSLSRFSWGGAVPIMFIVFMGDYVITVERWMQRALYYSLSRSISPLVVR